MLLPLFSLLDTQAIYPFSIESEEEIGIPTITPAPVPPPRPTQDGAFIWGVGGGGGGSWPDHQAVELAQAQWLADQRAYRDHLQAMGMLDKRGIVRRARRIQRHTYVSSRRPTMRPAPNPTRPTLAGVTKPSRAGVGKLASAALSQGASALARRHQRRNGQPDMLVAAAIGAGGFIAAKAITNLSPLPRPVTSSLCATASFVLAPRGWTYRQPLIVGASIAALDELLRVVIDSAPK